MPKKLDEAVVSRFHFISDQHPAHFGLMKATYFGSIVTVLCWMDTETEKIRPIAIMLNDSDFPHLKFEDGEITKD